MFEFMDLLPCLRRGLKRFGICILSSLTGTLSFFPPCLGLGTGAPVIESPYGDNVRCDEAPESISRAVASLPPEQMFELMKQMKVRLFHVVIRDGRK